MIWCLMLFLIRMAWMPASPCLAQNHLKPAAKFSPNAKPTEYLLSLAFSPDGKLLAAGSNDRTVTLWDVASGDRRATVRGHSSPVHALAFSPDGTLLATGSDSRSSGSDLDAGDDRSVRLWELANGTVHHKVTLDLHNTSGENGGCFLMVGAGFVAFSPDGKSLVSRQNGGDEERGNIKLWDVGTGKRLWIFRNRIANCVAFSNDGKLLAIADDKGIMLWDLEANVQKAVFAGLADARDLAFSPDDTLLAVGTDKDIKVCEAKTGRTITTFKVDRLLWNHDLAFSPDGVVLAACSDYFSITLWDLKTGKELAILDGPPPNLDRVVFSPDGSLIASTSQGEVYLWRNPACTKPAPKLPSAKLCNMP